MLVYSELYSSCAWYSGQDTGVLTVYTTVYIILSCHKRVQMHAMFPIAVCLPTVRSYRSLNTCKLSHQMQLPVSNDAWIVTERLKAKTRNVHCGSVLEHVNR